MHDTCKEYIPIQNIVLNYDRAADVRNMFVREHIIGDFITHSTNTYMNIFHYSQWKDLTGIASFFLRIKCFGMGCVSLYALSSIDKVEQDANNKEKPKLIDSHVFNEDGEHAFIFNIREGYRFFYISWSWANHAKFKVVEASYGCFYRACSKKIKVAIITPTFRNNKDIIHRVKKYRKFCKSNADLEQVFHLFVINNEIEDAKNLSVCEQIGVTLINNRDNLGGAGGFAQGARLAIKQGCFTHVLFMDDDALVHEESWFRTISLLRLLKQELQQNPISGAMFIRERPSYCHAMIEALNRHLHAICLCGQERLDSVENCIDFLSNGHAVFKKLIEVEGVAPYPYSPWWYCVYPIETFLQYGYPGPFFFRGDDMEYALRMKKAPVFINGICIWHPDFSKKQNSLRVYLNFRNYALRCIMHMKSYKYDILKFYCRYISRAFAANDYEKVAVIIQAIDDCINFNKIPQDGKRLNLHIRHVMEKWTNKEETISISHQQNKCDYVRNTWSSFLFVLLTLGGALVPRKLRHAYTRAPFLQIKGRWASQRAAYPDEDVCRYLQTGKSIQLWVKAFYSCMRFICVKNLNKKLAMN